ncbi:MAG: acyl-CoA dehydrogenase family protein, partial [Pseudomonadales bacterium]
MDFSLTAEQTLLQDSVSRFIQNDYDFASRQKLVHGSDGFSRTHWQTFAELGWLGVTFPESDGGFGGGAIDLMIMLEQFGKGLVVEPFVPTVVMAGGAIKIAGNAAQKGRYLAGVIDGSLQGALAYVEPQARFNLADITTTARAEGEGFVVNGHKAVVLNGPAADFLVVPVRTAGAQRDRDGVTLLIIDTASAGISRRDYPTVDGLRAAEISFEQVHVGADAVLGSVGGGLAVLEQVIDEAILAVGSEAVGAMEVLYKTTVEYCKTREQ